MPTDARRSRVDQLRIYPNLIGSTLHAAFENMSYAKLPADFAQIARCAAFVLHDARPADDFQVGNSGQMGQDLVLDALGEEGVCFFFAQIFKRKHRDAFFPGSGERTRRCLAQKREHRSGERRHHHSPIATAAQRTWVRCFLIACSFFGSCALPISLS